LKNGALRTPLPTGCSLATLAELARDGARGPFNAFVHTRQLDERMGGLLLPDLLIKPVQACRGALRAHRVESVACPSGQRQLVVCCIVFVARCIRCARYRTVPVRV
jgi:hypothetical protein